MEITVVATFADAGTACQHHPALALTKAAWWPAETHNLFLEPPSLELPLRLGWHGATSPFLEVAPSSTTFRFVIRDFVTHHCGFNMLLRCCFNLGSPQLSRGHLSLLYAVITVPLPLHERWEDCYRISPELGASCYVWCAPRFYRWNYDALFGKPSKPPVSIKQCPNSTG